MTNYYNIDFKRLILSLLPTFLRRPLIYSLLKVVLRPAVTGYDVFMKNRSENLYKLRITPQVCYLRKMLNDSFDVDLRGIYISDGNPSNWVIAYPQAMFNAEGGKQPLWAASATQTQPNKLIFTTSEGVTMVPRQGDVGASGLDFNVMVPSRIRGIADEKRMVSLVNYYKLASKRYAISYY